MKKLLLALLLMGVVEAQDINPAPTPFPPERPEYPSEILEAPSSLDQDNPAWLELVEYKMVVALVERVARENYWCQVDLDAGYPCRFGSLKESDYYVVKFLAELEKEKEKSELILIKSLRSSVCPDGEYYVTDFLDGTPLCVPFSTHQEAENHRFSLANNITNHTIAIDYERRKRGLSGFGIYAWWEDYQFTQNVSCENTIWEAGLVCFRFPDFKTTAIHYWHAREHLRQLEIELAKTKQKLPSYLDCNRFGGRNIWKTKSETRNSSVIVLDSSYCVDDRSLDDMKPIDIWLEDIYGNRIDNGSYRHCNRHNGNRLHYDFRRTTSDGEILRGEVVVVIGYEDETTECFYVPERSRDQR